MAEQLYWNPNTLTLPLGRGMWRLFQVSARRNVVISGPFSALADALVGGCDRQECERLFDELPEPIRAIDATEFTLWKNAYENSDFFNRQIRASDLEELSAEEFFELLEESEILSPCWPPATSFHKRSHGDRFRGSFYQQVGTESLYNRTTPTQWWTQQKFEDDLKTTRPTPYKFVEEHFLDGYFQEHLQGLDVLEIGSGTGYFTRKLAHVARRAVGMDYNAEYVDAARKSWSQSEYPNLEFHVGDIIDLQHGAEVFRQDKFDRVVLIDTFLFLFDEVYQSALHANRETILRNIRNLLHDDGQLLILDPHPLWLTPWLGMDELPFGVLTEYRNRQFKVIPTLQETSALLFDSGFRIRRVLEPSVDEQYQAVNPSAWRFMNEFPQWWFFEAEKASAA